MWPLNTARVPAPAQFPAAPEWPRAAARPDERHRKQCQRQAGVADIEGFLRVGRQYQAVVDRRGAPGMSRCRCAVYSGPERDDGQNDCRKCQTCQPECAPPQAPRRLGLRLRPAALRLGQLLRGGKFALVPGFFLGFLCLPGGDVASR